MSKPLAFNKSTTSTVNTVASTDAITDSTGNSLTSIITTLVNANTTEDLLIQNAPSLSGNNTFTGTTNTFNNPIRYDSSIGVGSLSNSKHLITKEYADGGISGLLATNNTWSGTNTFNAGALQLGKSDNSTVVNLAGTVTVPSGGSLALNAPTTCNNTLTVSNAFTASSSGISLSMVPTLQGNYSQPTGNALATKAYVDGLTAALPDTIQYGQTTTVRLYSGSTIFGHIDNGEFNWNIYHILHQLSSNIHRYSYIYRFAELCHIGPELLVVSESGNDIINWFLQ
jgi:hypothetical protein